MNVPLFTQAKDMLSQNYSTRRLVRLPPDMSYSSISYQLVWLRFETVAAMDLVRLQSPVIEKTVCTVCTYEPYMKQ